MRSRADARYETGKVIAAAQRHFRSHEKCAVFLRAGSCETALEPAIHRLIGDHGEERTESVRRKGKPVPSWLREHVGNRLSSVRYQEGETDPQTATPRMPRNPGSAWVSCS